MATELSLGMMITGEGFRRFQAVRELIGLPTQICDMNQIGQASDDDYYICYTERDISQL